MKPIRIKILPTAAADNNIAASQTPGAAALTLTALAAGPIDPGVSLVSGGMTPSAVLGLGRILVITSGGNDSGITWAVVGYDYNGIATSETVAGSNGTTSVTTKYYTSITSITPSASVATTVKVGTVGTTASAALKTIPLDFYGRIGATVQVDVSGTISYTVQMSYDDCLTPSSLSSNTFFATPASPTALTAQSASKYTQLPAGVCGLAVTIPTYTSTGYIILNVVSPANTTGA